LKKNKNNVDNLLMLIFDDYKKSIDKDSSYSLGDSLITYVGDSESYVTIFECFKYALQEQLSFSFTDSIKYINLDIDQVLGELIEMNEDESTGIIIWQMMGEGAKYNKLMKIYDVQCEEIINIYLKKFPEIFLSMMKIELR